MLNTSENVSCCGAVDVCGVSGGCIAKRDRRAHIRKLKEREYKRLRAVVPALAGKTNVKKVDLIEEAIRYIDELHRTLMCRLQPDDSDPESEDIPLLTQADVVSGARQLFIQKMAARSPQPVLAEVTPWQNVTSAGSAHQASSIKCAAL